MLKIAIIALLVALIAGALGMGGVSGFAMGVSKFFFSAFGLLVLLTIVLGVLAWRSLSHRGRGY